MIWKATVFLSLVLNVIGNEVATSEQHVKINYKKHDGHYGELSHIGSKEPEHHEAYAWAYPSYEFSYKVHDPHTHDIKGQEEHRDGDKVEGEYWLIQPDGHKRTVKYHADKHSGFHATVHYSDDYHHHEHEHEHEHKEEEHKEEEHKEEEKHEAHEKEIEEEHSDIKHVKESGESHEHEEKTVAEEGGEENRHGEESHHHEKVGKWIHDHHWGHRGHKHPYEMKYDHHDDDNKYYYGHRNAKISHQGYNHEARHKHYDNYNLYTGLSSYENRYGHKDHHGDYLKHQENRARPAYHGLDAPRAYRQQRNKAIVRENYVHPRYYRNDQFYKAEQ